MLKRIRNFFLADKTDVLFIKLIRNGKSDLSLHEFYYTFLERPVVIVTCEILSLQEVGNSRQILLLKRNCLILCLDLGPLALPLLNIRLNREQKRVHGELEFAENVG